MMARQNGFSVFEILCIFVNFTKNAIFKLKMIQIVGDKVLSLTRTVFTIFVKNHSKFLIVQSPAEIVGAEVLRGPVIFKSQTENDCDDLDGYAGNEGHRNHKMSKFSGNSLQFRVVFKKFQRGRSHYLWRIRKHHSAQIL